MRPPAPLPDENHLQFEWLSRLLLDRYRSGAAARTRVAIVLGAGSSIWSGLKTWDRMFKERLIDRAADTFREKRTFVEECWRELSATIGLPPRRDDPDERRRALIERAGIEDIASVALKYAVIGDKVHKLLDETFTPDNADRVAGAQPPQLGYELLAHFLKHGFIDHLLTFNFDELLDEAVENELGRDEFAYIASDQDVSTRSPASLPHLIKLHGTLSRPETLRFTRTATTSLPASTIRLLDHVLFDIPGATGQQSPDAKSPFLISMGYGWRDADVLHWLEARQDLVSGILIFSKSGDVERLRATFNPSRGWADGQVRVMDIDALCQIPPNQVTIDLLLWALWTDLEDAMRRDDVPFMPASRHILLGYLFGPNPNQVGTTLNKHETLTRFVVEFALHLAKCKGMINLSTTAGNNRIGRYYGPVRTTHSATARKFGCDLLALITAPGFIETFQHGHRPPTDDDRTVKPASYPDVKETYYAVAREPKDLAAAVLNENGFTTGAASRPRYSPESRSISLATGGNGPRFIQEQIAAIFEGPEIEVARRPHQRESWSLRSATPISTYIDLQTRSRGVLSSPWTELLVIAESGAWLPDSVPALDAASAGTRRILLIEADHPAEHEWPLRSKINLDLSEKWKRYEAGGTHVLRTALSWWQHNRHMTLAFANDGNGLRCIDGIYFRRRHKASRIQPLRVDPADLEDVAELVLTFLSYIRRSLKETLTTEGLLLRNHACSLAGQLQHPASVRARVASVINELNLMV